MQEQVTQFGPADTGCIIEYRLEYRRQLAGRTADCTEYLRGRRLPLKGICQLLGPFGELSATCLLRLKQARVLDRDNRLVGKGLHQGSLLLGQTKAWFRMPKDDGSNPLVRVQQRHERNRAHS